MSDMLEKQVESYLYNKLEKLGVECLKFLPFHKTGMPDRVIILPNGLVHWVELKTDGGKLSAIQKLRHKLLEAKGHKVFVLWNKEEVDKYVGLLYMNLHEGNY